MAKKKDKLNPKVLVLMEAARIILERDGLSGYFDLNTDQDLEVVPLKNDAAAHLTVKYLDRLYESFN